MYKVKEKRCQPKARPNPPKKVRLEQGPVEKYDKAQSMPSIKVKAQLGYYEN